MPSPLVSHTLHVRGDCNGVFLKGRRKQGEAIRGGCKGGVEAVRGGCRGEGEEIRGG